MTVCSACGRRFGGLGAFEAHRTGHYTGEHPAYGRKCIDPPKHHQDAFGVWREDINERERERMRQKFGRKTYKPTG